MSEVHKASHSRPCSSCVPPTPTTGCRNSSGASSTPSSRRRRPSSPPRAASAADGLVARDGTKGNTTPQRGEGPHSLQLQTPLGSDGREVTPSTSQIFDQLDTANVSARQVVARKMCVNNCHKARLGRTAPTMARSRWDQAPE